MEINKKNAHRYEWDRARADTFTFGKPDRADFDSWCDGKTPEELRTDHYRALCYVAQLNRLCRVFGGACAPGRENRDVESAEPKYADIGLYVLTELAAHIAHADEVHPWGPDMPPHLALKVARKEFDEAADELFLAEQCGLKDPDAPLCDEAALVEHIEHFWYECGDLAAVLAKILRSKYDC